MWRREKGLEPERKNQRIPEKKIVDFFLWICNSEEKIYNGVQNCNNNQRRWCWTMIRKQASVFSHIFLSSQYQYTNQAEKSQSAEKVNLLIICGAKRGIAQKCKAAKWLVHLKNFPHWMNLKSEQIRKEWSSRYNKNAFSIRNTLNIISSTTPNLKPDSIINRLFY